MDVDCVNCGRPDAERATPTRDGETTLSEIGLCAACLDVFETTGWIRVEESPAAG